MNIYDLINKPDNRNYAFLTPRKDPLSYAELTVFAEELKSKLSGYGLKKGARVAIAMNNLENSTAIVALAACGLIACPVSYKYTQHEHEKFLDSFGIDVLISSNEIAESMAIFDAARKLDVPIIDATSLSEKKAGLFSLTAPNKEIKLNGENLGIPTDDDIAILLPTSGTTSEPKVVPITHRSFTENAKLISQTMSLKPEDRFLVYTPSSHSYGLTCNLATGLYSGSGLFFGGQFTVGHHLEEVIEQQGITTLFLIPAMYRGIAKHCGEDNTYKGFSRIKNIGSAGSPLNSDVVANMRKAFPGANLTAIFGATETLIMTIETMAPEKADAFTGAKQLMGYIGKTPLNIPEGTEVRIINPETGEAVSRNEAGEMVIKGPSVLNGYLPTAHNQNPNEGVFTADGFFRTGDIVIEKDGHIFYVSRKKEMIKVNETQVSPAEVEWEIAEIKAIKRVVAFGIPHSKKGQAVGAVIEVDKTLLEELAHDKIKLEEFHTSLTHKMKELSHHKWPSVYVLTDELPTMGALQKISRTKMAEMLGLDENSKGIIILSNNIKAPEKALKPEVPEPTKSFAKK